MPAPHPTEVPLQGRKPQGCGFSLLLAATKAHRRGPGVVAQWVKTAPCDPSIPYGCQFKTQLFHF